MQRKIRKWGIRGLELVTKVAHSHQTCGYVYVPKAWIGRKVAVILLPKDKSGGEDNGEKEKG